MNTRTQNERYQGVSLRSKDMHMLLLDRRRRKAGHRLKKSRPSPKSDPSGRKKPAQLDEKPSGGGSESGKRERERQSEGAVSKLGANVSSKKTEARLRPAYRVGARCASPGISGSWAGGWVGGWPGWAWGAGRRGRGGSRH